MGPSKRKGSTRRQVLDLATKENSPSRPTWQSKYQHALLRDVTQQNGDSQTALSSKVNNNPLSEFLGNYNSDSDSEETSKPSNNSLDAKVEDFLKEIQSISVEPSTNSNPVPSETLTSQSYSTQTYKTTTYPSSVTCWQQCYDQNSGYPYYWNTETNEVTWDMPPDLKAAITSVALKQQAQQQSVPQQVEPEPVPETKKKSSKYPWQTESDSEDEKIEMITSFGPQTGEGSDEEEEPKNKKVEKAKAVITSVEYYSQPSKIRSACISLAPEDPEGMNDSSYETSSLLAHGVQDNGPPGDDSFQDTKGTPSDSKLKTNKSKTFLHNQSKEEAQNQVSQTPRINNDNLVIENKLQVNIENKLSNKGSSEQDSKIADDVIAQIEKETPPDYKNSLEKEKQAEEISNNEGSSENISTQQNLTTSKLSAIALVANYSDDSESEDNNSSDKHKSSGKIKISPSKPLFPIEIPQEKEEKIKPVFPCVEEDISKMILDNSPKETLQEDLKPVNNIYKSEIEITDPGAFKAFKRKKRIEFATTTSYSPSTSKLSDVKTHNLESGASSSSSNSNSNSSNSSCSSSGTTQYNMDPNSNEHRGFGFSANKYQPDSERKTYKNCGGIQFVKAETINLKSNTDSKEKPEIENEKEAIGEILVEPGQNEEIQDSATLLKEKLDFLTGGNKEISPIQHMAIELETLVLAWQQGALTPSYLLRWLNEKCAELIHHEKKAAPSGWTCLWDRQNKRYYYRNATTKAVQWEYPSVEEKIRTKEDVEAGGDEMDICDTPPHLSPTEPVKQTDERPSTPPPPVISDTNDYVAPLSPMPQPPSPPKISFCSENESSTAKSSKKKKRKIDETTNNNIDETNIGMTATVENSEEAEPAPPLPPMPPPPPPPPEESPPPLPESPPPLPLDTDQPLPPGVDEPEYSLYRRVSPKHCYKKAQTDSSAYSAELMMTYGYGLPVVPSNSQAMTLPLQTLDHYHTYMHDPVTNPYLVQSASTSHVIQCSAKKPKVSINSELMSFYSDLAMLEAPSESSSNSQSKPSQPITQEPEPTPAPVVTTATTVAVTTPVVSSSSSAKNNEAVTSNGVNIKKKKKTKATSGLSLKKKGVSSLVAKWQQVQQEVKKDFSDDEDVSPLK